MLKFIRKNFEATFLTTLLIIAFLVRFWNLNSIPVGFNADEASFGYDAYSILKTGKDQWGATLPLTLKSFGDYKSPLYSYLTIPFIWALGLNTTAVRLPAVIVGTLSVYVVYLLSKRIFGDNKKIMGLPYAAIPPILLSVNPWSVMMSRGAFEAGLLVLFIPLGLHLFLKGLEDSRYLVWSSVSFGLSLFSYHSAKIVVPGVIFFAILIYIKQLWKIGLHNLVKPLTVILIFLFAVGYTLSIGGGARIAERSITQGALEEGARIKIGLIQDGKNPLLAKLFHNKYQVVVSRLVYNYSQYFSHKFLISQGAGESYYGMVKGIGVINVIELILIIGLVPLLRKNISPEILLILSWLLLAPLPAALSTGVGYAGNRAISMLPALQIVAGLGFVGWVDIFSRASVTTRRLGLSVFCLLTVLNVFTFIGKYFTVPESSSYKQMLYGNLEISEWLVNESAGKNVVVSRGLSEPQIFLAFAGKFDPSEFQKYSSSWDMEGAGVRWLDQMEGYKLRNYTIKSVDWKTDATKDTLIVYKPEEGGPKDSSEKTIFYPNGEPAIYVKSY